MFDFILFSKFLLASIITSIIFLQTQWIAKKIGVGQGVKINNTN